MENLVDIIKPLKSFNEHSTVPYRLVDQSSVVSTLVLQKLDFKTLKSLRLLPSIQANANKTSS